MEIAGVGGCFSLHLTLPVCADNYCLRSAAHPVQLAAMGRLHYYQCH